MDSAQHMSCAAALTFFCTALHQHSPTPLLPSLHTILPCSRSSKTELEFWGITSVLKRKQGWKQQTTWFYRSQAQFGFIFKHHIWVQILAWEWNCLYLGFTGTWNLSLRVTYQKDPQSLVVVEWKVKWRSSCDTVEHSSTCAESATAPHQVQKIWGLELTAIGRVNRVNPAGSITSPSYWKHSWGQTK